MKCYCNETDTMFIFCVEEVKNAPLEDVIQHMAWKKDGGKFLLSYPQNAFSNQSEKELISSNFSRCGQAVFESSLSGFGWKKPLELLARTFNENKIEWYIVGSIGDLLRGVDVKPSDMDIVINTRDFFMAKDICYQNFPDSVIAPFTDNQDTAPLRYFGRLFLAGAMVDIAADEEWNRENRQQEFRWFKNPISGYEKTSWNGFKIYVESLQLRYQIEIARNREDRIKAFEKHLNRTELKAKE